MQDSGTREPQETPDPTRSTPRRAPETRLSDDGRDPGGLGAHLEALPTTIQISNRRSETPLSDRMKKKAQNTSKWIRKWTHSEEQNRAKVPYGRRKSKFLHINPNDASFLQSGPKTVPKTVPKFDHGAPGSRPRERPGPSKVNNTYAENNRKKAIIKRRRNVAEIMRLERCKSVQISGVVLAKIG